MLDCRLCDIAYAQLVGSCGGILVLLLTLVIVVRPWRPLYSAEWSCIILLIAFDMAQSVVLWVRVLVWS